MSKNAGKSEMGQATALMRDNIARLEAIGIPTIEAQKISLESPELVGMLEAGILEPSKFAEITMNRRLQAAQMSALEDITGVAEAGGLDAQTRLNLEEGLARAAGAEQARLQQLKEDPTLGQGQRLALQSQAIQGTGQSARNVALQSAANAQQAKMAALGQQANLASSMQQQELGLAEKKASAADVINQFNTQNKQNVNARNLSERQRIADLGKEIGRQQEMYNKGLIQQQFQNQVAKATGVSGAQSNLANMYAQQGAASAQGQATQNAAILGGLTGLAGAGIGAYGDIQAAKAGNIQAAKAGKVV